MMAILESLTVEETFSLTRHRVLRAMLLFLIQEINASLAFEGAIAADFLAEINRGRRFDAALVGDFLERMNELRALVNPPLPPLAEINLAAKAPQQALPGGFTARPRPQVTVARMLETIKRLLGGATA